MQAPPLHPLIVHLPMALAALMPLVTGGLLLAWWRGYLPKRTWLVAAALQLALFASGLVAMQTGETDEERVEHVVAEAAIERHEEAAELFTWSAGVLLAVALLPLVMRNERLARVGGLLTFTGACVLLGLGYRVGSAGGELVYRHGAAAAYAAGAVVAPDAERHEDHDDDPGRRAGSG